MRAPLTDLEVDARQNAFHRGLSLTRNGKAPNGLTIRSAPPSRSSRSAECTIACIRRLIDENVPLLTLDLLAGGGSSQAVEFYQRVYRDGRAITARALASRPDKSGRAAIS
jgi:hypothetical protein